MPIIPARLTSILHEADRIAPGRRRTSDGTYANKPGDHNVDARGVVHAVDVSLSMPGTPFWEPRFQQFDVHAWQRKIAAQYIAAGVAERARRWPWLFDGGYMHAYDAALKVDVIFHPARSLTWRVDNSPPSEHIQHGHFSIGHTVRSEQDTQPIFTTARAEDDVTPQDKKDIIDGVLKVLRRQPDGSPGLIGDEVAHVFGGYPDGKQYEDGVLIQEWRKDKNVAKR